MTLQGSWRFEENTGTTSEDTSGVGRTMTNIPGWTSGGHTGNAMALDGSQAGGLVTIDSQFQQFDSSTFMCWVRLNSVSTFQEIVYGPRYGSTGAWYVGVDTSGRLVAAWGDASMTGTTVLAPGTWYHIAFAFDWAAGTAGSNAALYLNGAIEATSTGFPLNPGTLLWGGNMSSTDGDQPLNGVLDDARWYSEQLAQSDIQTLMNTPVGSAQVNAGTNRFFKDASGTWQPLYTVRKVNPPSISSLYGWQLDATNTGLARYGINGDHLPVYTGLTKPAAGTTIVGRKITTPLDLSNGNITIERCLVQPTGVAAGLQVLDTFNATTSEPGDGPVTIKDCTIDGSLLDLYSAAMCGGVHVFGTVTGNYLTGFGSGFAVIAAGDTADTLIANNYVAHLVGWGDPAADGNHSDSFTVRDFTAATVPARQLTVQNNRFNNDSPNATGSCFIQTFSGEIDNTTVQGNLLEGSGWNMGLNELNYTYSNIHSINNRFDPQGYGASYVQGGAGYTEWTDNYLNDPNQPNNQGAVVTSG